jgi:hypothetical protein
MKSYGMPASKNRRSWPRAGRLGICPERGAQEPDDRHQGQAAEPEMVPLHRRETDPASRDDEEVAAQGEPWWMHRVSPLRDPECIIPSSAKAVKELGGRWLRSPHDEYNDLTVGITERGGFRGRE